ncbi:MAG: TlpA family protein disulfide reductase [Desulfobulbaceae bacterium]|nr:TlpA family protein disulfide reductase [Desulfobulbaceae bacterium]
MRVGNGRVGGRVLVGMLALLMMAVLAGPARAAKKMEAFAGETVNGLGKFDSATLQGKVVLVNFWATWCPPCRKEIPSLVKLQESYRSKGLVVVGVSMDEGGRTMVGKFLEKQGVNYPVIIGDSSVAKGFGGVIGVPASFLVDRKGELIRRFDGYASEEELREELEKLLK